MSKFLEGVKAYWVQTNRPSKYNEWSLEAGNLTDDHVKQLKADGLGSKILDKGDERGKYIRISQATTQKDGTPNSRPEVVDSNKRTFTGLVGNGSTVNVKYRTYDYDNQYGKGTSAVLQKIQLVDLVPYSSNSSDEEDFDVVEGGFALDADGADGSDDLPLETPENEDFTD